MDIVAFFLRTKFLLLFVMLSVFLADFFFFKFLNCSVVCHNPLVESL